MNEIESKVDFTGDPSLPQVLVITGFTPKCSPRITYNLKSYKIENFFLIACSGWPISISRGFRCQIGGGGGGCSAGG